MRRARSALDGGDPGEGRDEQCRNEIASARDKRSVLVIVPFFARDQLSIDIDVLTRNEIFGGDRTPEQPTGLP